LIGCIKENISNEYDGVVVTHGTDTLQYSAAAIGYCFGNASLPICIVSANAPIESQSSNALDNLHGAISFIKEGCGKGAFVVYRNSNSDTVAVHRATRLMASNAYSDEVLSVGGMVYGAFNEKNDFVKNPFYHETEDEAEPLNAYALRDISEDIMLIEPYVGMRYPEIDERVKYILLNTYHSGTLNTKSHEAEAFFASARKKGVRVYASGASNGAIYSSAESFETLGITPIRSLSPIAAYVKLWLISSLGKNTDELLGVSIGGDIVF
ncbi:MAG: asparaginase, partial [Clostridia bacterium]|nr:asparaginase [Clostridia bacterium]